MAGERVAILGAGPAGLSAGWKLAEGGAHVLVLEKGLSVGGQSTTFSWKGMRLDYGPHKVYTQDPRIQREVESLFEQGELLSIPKRSRIRLAGAFFDFPVRIQELLFKLNPLVAANCGSSYALALAASKLRKPREDSYESYMLARFGRGTYDLIFGPYARKVWGEPRELSASLAKSRVAVPSLLDLARRLVAGDRGKPAISAKEFSYPRKGIVELSEKMAARIRRNGGEILLCSTPEKLVLDGKRITRLEYGSGGQPASFEPTHVVSTIPIAHALSLIKPATPEVNAAADSASTLRHRNLILAVIVVKKDRAFPDNWLFFPEAKFIFNRVYEQKGFSEEMVQKGQTAVCAEITCAPADPIWTAGDEEVCGRVIADLVSAEVLKKEDVTDSGVFRMELAYPMYDIGYEARLARALGFLDSLENLYAIGRNGSFNYAGMLDCMDMGIRTAEHMLGSAPAPLWAESRKRFQNYVTVD